MTPNLTKLFERVRSLEPLYQVVDGVTRSSMDKHIAGQQLAVLFATHGQALIEALDTVLYRFDSEAFHRAEQLLATLERDAGGQP
jgi:hypothetical protein